MEIRRGQLGRKVEIFRMPKYGAEATIYLDVSRGEFSGLYANQILSAGTIAEVRSMITKIVETNSTLNWIGVIEINFGGRWTFKKNDDNEEREAKADLTFKRYWIAKKLDGIYAEASWGKEYSSDKGFGDRMKRMREFGLRQWNAERREYEARRDFALPFVNKGDRHERETPEYYIAYTDEMWAALISIGERMDELQQRLIKILGTEESRAKLTTNIAGLLPAPEPKRKAARR